MIGPYNNDVFVADRPLSSLERSIAEQEAYIRRMITHGAPTQAAEDRLRKLKQKLVRFQEDHRRSKNTRARQPRNDVRRRAHPHNC